MSGSVADNIDRQSGVIAEPAGGPEVRSDDPSASAGTVWFNTTSGVLKVFRLVGAWSSGGNLGTARNALHGTNGTQSACFVTAGSSASGDLDTTEEYNGSTWGAGGDASQTTNASMTCGTLTAGLLWGGYSYPPGTTRNRTEEYDGTSFSTSGGTLLQAVYGAGATGTQTAGLSVGGSSDPTKYATAEEYDGTSWADGGDLGAAQYGTTTVGILTAALTAGGDSGSKLNTAYEYNGTSWTSVTAQSESKRYAMGFGVQTNAVICGGDTGSVVSTVQIWSGSAWSSGTSMSEIKRQGSAAGTGSTGLVTGGYLSDITNSTLEYGDVVTARTITDS